MPRLSGVSIWAPSSEFVSSSIPSWQILTAHAKPFRGGRDLAFCQKVPLDSLLVRSSSGGSGETARMRRLAWTFAARVGDKYQIRLTRSNYSTEMHFYSEMKVLPSLLANVDWKNVSWKLRGFSWTCADVLPAKLSLNWLRKNVRVKPINHQ